MQHSLGEKIEQAGDFLDCHLQIFRQCSFTALAVFCAVKMKHSKFVHKFRSISSIPESYFGRGKIVSLPCFVREIESSTGRIKVEHMPFFHRIFSKGNAKDWLEIELFSVKFDNESAIPFLKDNLMHSFGKLQLFQRNDKIILGDLRVKREHLLNSRFDWLLSRCNTSLSLILVARSLAIPQKMEKTSMNNKESKLMHKIIRMHKKVKRKMRIQRILSFLKEIFSRK
jgi:hypothetical protein